MRLAVGIVAGAVALGISAGGCSSAPADTEERGEAADSLNVGGGGIGSIGPLCAGPVLVSADCYSRVMGVQISVPDSVTVCPNLNVPSLGDLWLPDYNVPVTAGYSGAASYQAMHATPSWDDHDRVCVYSVENVGHFDFGAGEYVSQFSNGSGLSSTQIRSLISNLCSSMSAKGMAFNEVHYTLPGTYTCTLPPRHTSGITASPPQNDASFVNYCHPYGIMPGRTPGGCDTCVKNQ